MRCRRGRLDTFRRGQVVTATGRVVADANADAPLGAAPATIHSNFFCDLSIDRQMQAANQEEATNAAEADASWVTIDREVTDAAVWAPLAVVNEVDFLSARVSNYQYNPVFGVLLDQLSVRRN